LFLVKAGPNHPFAFFDSIWSREAWYQLNPLGVPRLLKQFEWLGMNDMKCIFENGLSPDNPKYAPTWTRPPLLGKLATKEEAAGKIRVFAILDY
jgi:hypothetical protein